MSREFGSYCNGYFHEQIRLGAEDCLAGRDDLTRLWGAFLNEFNDIAYAIASSEACDSGPEATVIATIEKMKALKAALSKIEDFTEPHRRCMEHALRKALANPPV
jgi:hypothetical protein